MSRERLMDDSGYTGFEECGNYECCFENAFKIGEKAKTNEIINMIKNNWCFWNTGIIAEVIRKIEELED